MGIDINLLCTSCVHKDVCGLKRDYERAQLAVDNLKVYGPEKDDKVSVTELSQLHFIKPVTLHCTYYVTKPVNTIR